MFPLWQDLSDIRSGSLSSTVFDMCLFSGAHFSVFSTGNEILSAFRFESSFLQMSFKPTTQILTFLLKPDTCF